VVLKLGSFPFRVANGKIAEHWDVMQEEVPAAQSANDNSS